MLREGHVELATASHRGSWDVGVVTLREGINWVDVNCRAEGEPEILTFTMGTVGAFTVDCPSTENRIGVNQLDLAEGREDRFTVEVADTVRWYVSVQVAGPERAPSPTI
ncbi:VCBS domain-containing protein [Streptomyces sp. WMMC905]|uniref:VCBS domain-containing protein n=1 Tax=Streptomyces sp. WMMC905 TaxID=3404123 RepID=UPI003B95EA8B